MTWNDGYVVDVAYTEQAYREMTPVWLSLASVLNRQPPVDTTRPFTYVELGCGRGLTACTIAATNPSAEVWACDFNPAHVERARQWATDARLDNCAFEEASFEDLAGDREVGPSQADVIALHGVFSWVSPVNRRHIVDIIRTRLRPGGLVYVSYNVPTGWAGMARRAAGDAPAGRHRSAPFRCRHPLRAGDDPAARRRRRAVVSARTT